MSVYAFVVDAENQFEKSLSMPVVTEKFYDLFWMVATKELGLRWIPVFLWA
jgi:hypothetical protein